MSEADRAIPTLPGRSLPATLAFYERLGFEGELLADGTYLIVERGSIELLRDGIPLATRRTPPHPR